MCDERKVWLEPREIPDGMFSGSKAAKSVDPRIWCGSETSIDGFTGFEFVIVWSGWAIVNIIIIFIACAWAGG